MKRQLKIWMLHWPLTQILSVRWNAKHSRWQICQRNWSQWIQNKNVRSTPTWKLYEHHSSPTRDLAPGSQCHAPSAGRISWKDYMIFQCRQDFVESLYVLPVRAGFCGKFIRAPSPGRISWKVYTSSQSRQDFVESLYMFPVLAGFRKKFISGKYVYSHHCSSRFQNPLVQAEQGHLSWILLCKLHYTTHFKNYKSCLNETWTENDKGENLLLPGCELNNDSDNDSLKHGGVHWHL